MLTENFMGKEDKRCKGIKKCVVTKTLDFDELKRSSNAIYMFTDWIILTSV